MVAKAKSFFTLILLITFVSCEDVIEIALPAQQPRLTIDAIIPIDIAQSSTTGVVKVSLTDGFFGTVPLTKLDNIIIIAETIEGDVITETVPIQFRDIANNFGIYETRSPIPHSLMEDNVRFSLYIEHEERVYLAQTFFSPAPPINSISQTRTELFNEEVTEIIVSMTDIPEQKNYYVFDFGLDQFITLEDSFFAGQDYTFSYFYSEAVAVGTEIEIRLLGADQGFYNYMGLLIEQADGALELFQTPAATVRGNFKDVTNIDNIDLFDNVERPEVFALGYFAIVQENKLSLIID